MSFTKLKAIILYDIPSITPGRPWSPNTMKTRYDLKLTVLVAVYPKSLTDRHHLVRYCLAYKRLPFTTVWVELPDIAGLIESKGNTNPPYTLPAIEDPNTGTFIVDSLAIAAYLDETYPETPKVLSPAASRMLEGVGDAFSFGSGGGAYHSDVAPRLVFLVLASERLNPVSKEYYHRTRAARLGEVWTTIADACSAGPGDRVEQVQQGIEAIRGTWRKVTALYDRQGDSKDGTLAGPFALGEEPCFLDFAVAGRIKFVLDGITPFEAEALVISEGDRLVRLVESLEKYYEY